VRLPCALTPPYLDATVLLLLIPILAAHTTFHALVRLTSACRPDDAADRRALPAASHAGVAKLAYAQDLKSCSPKGEYGFDPRLLHHHVDGKVFAACSLGSDDEVIEDDRTTGGT
jgi:hypothetical protein